MENFISEASFWLPELLIPSPWIEHAPFAFWLTGVHRPAVFLELGPNCSYSYFLFNQALKTFGIQARSFAVDTSTGDDRARTEQLPELRAGSGESHEQFSEFIQSTLDEAAARFADHTIDLIHFGNLRSYEDARRDFEAWRPKLSARGIVLLHNTHHLGCVGVDRLWNELKAEYSHFEFFHGNGLGVLNIGGHVSDALAALFTASNDEILTKTIRHTYSRLGAGLWDKAELRTVAGKFTELTGQVTVRDELLATQNQELALRDQSILAKDRLIEEHSVALQTLHAALTYRDNLIAQKDDLIVMRDDTILEKDHRLENLHVELQNLTAEVAVRDEFVIKRDDLITALTKNNQALTNLLEDRSADLQAVTAELARRDQLIAQKDQSIATKSTVIQHQDDKLQRLSDQLKRAETEIVRQYGLLVSSSEELSMTKRILSSNSEELTLATAAIQRLQKNWLSRIRMFLKEAG